MKSTVHDILQPQKADDVFPELALTLLVFIRLLYQNLIKKGVSDVYFLAREGQPLMHLFETYQSEQSGPIQKKIRCHYLEVSRRSTFLPSLGPLANEQFEILFRQYRAISIFEFLASLGLDGYISQFANALGIKADIFMLRTSDLPTDPVYRLLKESSCFQDIYETERLSRQNAFIAYLNALSGGALPETLHIVDVGWKGTIQDNLYSLLCNQSKTNVQNIEGYYVGLVALGAASIKNNKSGLLFSVDGSRSPNFHTFNENRALFEVTLAANHGSVASYLISPSGIASALRSEFEEEQMVTEFVFPLQAKLFDRFSRLIPEINKTCDDQVLLDELVGAAHARMVFNPTKSEIKWFSTVFHVENFGFFENSKFGQTKNLGGFIDRMTFTWKLIFKPRSIDFGFWPWLLIRQRSFPMFAYVYRFIRSRVSA